MMLSGSGLRKSFDNKAVLDNLSISIERGSITALLGETGVGKSTLLRALAMIDPPEAGAIELDGEVYQYPLHSRIPPRPWPKLGVVFQDLFLWPHLTIRDNILLPLRLNNVTGASELLAEVSNEFHICDLLDRYPNQVSRGQRQAVAIARALALKPRYILLDEITASLDFSRSAKLGIGLRMRADQGAGILLITHQLSFARTQADCIMFMSNGSIVESGPPSILDTPSTHELQGFIRLVGHMA